MRVRRLFHGWRIVGALSVTETISYGVLIYAFTVFIGPMHAELGWSVAALSAAFSVGLLVSGFAALPVGRILDSHGPRLLMTAGSVAAAGLLLAWSVVDSLAAFFLIWVLFGGSLAAVLYDPAFTTVAVWFRRRRGVALTVLTFVAGFASVIFIPLAGRLVELHGWREALRWLALIVAVGTVPLHALVLRRRPADLGLAQDGAGLVGLFPGPTPAAATADPARLGANSDASLAAAAVFKTAQFRWLNRAFAASNFVISALVAHIVPFLVLTGREPAQAAFFAGAVGLMALPGRLVFTPLGDYVSRHTIAAVLFLTQAAGVAVLLLGSSDFHLWAFVIVYGAGFGAITPARAALVAEAFGSADYGKINARMAVVQAIARAAAPVTIGVAVTLTGSYAPSLALLALLSAVAAFSVLVAGRPAGASR